MQKETHEQASYKAKWVKNKIKTLGLDKYSVVIIVKSVVRFLEYERQVDITQEDYFEMRNFLDSILEEL